jgi:hypothetical protein
MYNPDFAEPLCIVSRLTLALPSFGDDIYWLAVAQAYQKDLADGKVKILDAKISEDWTAEEKSFFNEVVKGGRFISAALPLVEISKLSDVERRLIDPVIGYRLWPL